MILPQTHTGTLLLLILSLLLVGSWANLYKLAGKWRFELFYFDFTIGFAVAVLILAFTVGNLGYDGFAVMDDLSHAGKRQWVFGFLAGVVFNLGNLLMLAAISVAGMAVAVPVGLGLALALALNMGHWSGGPMNAAWLASGTALILVAIALAWMAYAAVMRRRRAALLAENKKRASRSATSWKGMILAITGGLVLAGMYPLLARATPPEVGLGPFALALLFGLGICATSFVYNIFFMNLPVQGEPLEIRDYFKAKPARHLFGFFGGLLCAAGLLAHWMSVAVPQEAQLSKPAALVVSQGAFVIAALWGLLVWREFREASGAGKTLALVMLVFFAGGLGLLALSIASA